MQTVNVNGIRLAYDIQGKGDPLVLITGIGYCSWFWHKVTPGLSEHYQVITFDNRGAGDTDKPEGPYSIPMMAADTAGLMDALELQEAFVMGHSLGGFIAQELAVTRPDLVRKLILAGTNYGGMNIVPPTPEAFDVLTNREGDPVELIRRGIEIACAPGFSQEHPEVADELMAYRFQNRVPPQQYQAQVMAGLGMSGFTEEQVTDRMSRIQVPVLLLFGEHDRVVPRGNAALMADKLPDAEVKILPEAGHLFPIERPEATVEAIHDFLESK